MFTNRQSRAVDVNRWTTAKAVHDALVDGIRRIHQQMPEEDEQRAERIADQLIDTLHDHKQLLTMIWTVRVGLEVVLLSFFISAAQRRVAQGRAVAGRVVGQATGRAASGIGRCCI